MRRTASLGFAAALALTGAVSAAAVTTTPTTAAWRQTDGAASESRANLDESTLTPATIGNALQQLSIAQHKVSPECSDYSPTSPLLSASHLFVLSGGHIRQYDVNSGRLSRNFKLFFADTTTYRRLLLGQGAVIAGGDDCISQSDPSSEVFAFNSTTGRPLWGWSGPALRDMVESGTSVVVSGGTLGSGNFVTALSTADGSTNWSLFPDCLSGPTPVVGGNVVVSGCQQTTTGDGAAELMGLRLADGHPAWVRHGDWTVYRGDSDTSQSAQVYVTNPRGRTVALDSQTGKRLYRMPGASYVAAADDQRVYAACGGGRRLCAYDKTTGARLWRVQYDGATPLLAVGGRVLYLDDGRALRASSGHLLTRLWSTGTASSLAVGRGHVVAMVDGVHTDVYGLAS